MLRTVSNIARVWPTSSRAPAMERTSSVVFSATSYRRCMSACMASTVAWRFKPRHGGIDFAHPALRALDGCDGCRHELLDPRGLVGAGGQRTEALVCALHPRHQLAATVVELRAERCQFGESLIEIFHHATARIDLAHRL